MTADFKQGTNLAGKILASGQVVTQVATISGAPTGGTWTPFVGGVSAGTVAYNASAATLQTASRTVNASINVTGSAGGPYTITVPDGSAAVVTLGVNALTGGTAPTVTMTGVDTTIYTVPALSAVKVATAILTNVSTLAVTVSVSVVPSGDILDGTHKIVNIPASSPLQPGDSTKLDEIEGAMLDAGVIISINTPAASAINYLLTGAVSS